MAKSENSNQNKSDKKKKVKSITRIPEKDKRKEPTREDGTIYVVPKGERKVFHLEVEKKQYDAATGKKLSKSHILKLADTRSYEQFIKNHKELGFSYSLIHDPRPYFGMNAKEIKEQDNKFLGIEKKKK